MIVLNANVLSEIMRLEPDSAVAAWVSARPASSLFTTTVTQAEILYGVRLLPAAKRRSRLEAGSSRYVRDRLRRTRPALRSGGGAGYAEIAVARRRAGRPISQFDAQIAAIARSRDAGVATRNVADFEGCGIGVIDPWQA